MRFPGCSRTKWLSIFILSLGLGSPLAAVRSLSVTEIFIDGTDEFIEISNDMDQSWTGTVYLSGAKSSLVPLPIDLGVGESAVFADKDILFASGVVVASGYGWSFTDTHSIDREILDASGSVMDVIQITTGVVVDVNNTDASLYLSGGERSMTTISGSIGMIDGYSGSPTYRGQHLDDALAQTGNRNEGNSIQCMNSSPWRISEVFLGSHDRSAFIELEAQEIVHNPHISFTGEQLTGMVIDLTGQRYPDDYMMITRGSTGVISDDIDVIISSGYQLGSGLIAISGQSGQVLDSVSVAHVISGSQNFGGHGCGRDFDTIGLSTPGYPQSIETYFPSIVSTPPQECPLPVSDPSITLDGVRPAPPSDHDETIALTIHDDLIYDLDPYYLLKNGGSKRYLYGPEASSGTILLTGNFAMSNTNDTCVELRSDEDILLDYLCYKEEQATEGVWVGRGDRPRIDDEETGDESAGQGSGSIFSGSVQIDSLLYDPPGSDTGAEQITITNTSNQTFDPEQLRILIGEANTKRYIRETIAPGQTVTATATFSLSNSRSTCVELHHNGGILDTYCYTINTTSITTTKKTTKSSSKAADIEIVDLVFNPPGKDTNRESVTLSLPHDESRVDLSDYRLLVGTTRKRLEGMLYPGEEKTITKTRGFVNSRASCATLIYEEKPIDYRCRSPEDEQSAAMTGAVTSGAVQSPIQSLIIHDVIYDPEGNDKGREQIHIAYTGAQTLNLTDAHLLINGRKKNLEGSIRTDQDKRLIDNFRFPNTKKTCVQLRALEVLYDEYCYDPTPKEHDERGLAGHMTGVTGAITAIYPNPPGADKESERVRAMMDSTADTELLSLQIGSRTTRTKPSVDHETNTIYRQGSLALPNRVGCVRLLYADELIDTFCYFSTDENQTLTTDQADRHDMSHDAISLLNRLTITSQGKGKQKQFCLRTNGFNLVCKDAPVGRTTTTPPERFYRDYIGSLHGYLARNWSPIYYNTDIAQHVKLYRAMRDVFRDSQSHVTIHSMEYDIDTSIDDLRVAQQQTSYYDIFIDVVVRPLAKHPSSQ